MIRRFLNCATLCCGLLLMLGASEGPLDQLAQARLEVADGRFAAARVLARQLREARDGQVAAESWNLVGLLSEQQKQSKDAVLAYARAAELAPVGTAAWCHARLYAGLLAQRAGDHPTALAAFGDVLGTSSADAVQVAAGIAQGDSLLAQQDPAGARNAWQRATALAAQLYADQTIDREGLTRRLGEVGNQLEQAKQDSDEAAFRRAEGLRARADWPAAEAAYRALIVKWPASEWAPPSVWAIGVCLLRAGHSAEAIAWWQAFIAAAPNGAWRGQAYVSLGDAALELEADAEQAKRFYQAAERGYHISANMLGWPEVAYAIHQRLGLITYAGGQRVEAIEWFRKAAALNPPMPDGLVCDAPNAVVWLIEELTKGREFTHPCLTKAGPRGVTVLLMMADLQVELFDLDAAKPIYERIVAKDSRFHPDRNQRAWAAYQLGRCAHFRFDIVTAERWYRVVCDDNRGVPFGDYALRMLAQWYIQERDTADRGLALFKRIMDEYPDGEWAERALLWTAFRQESLGRLPESKATYLLFMKRYPTSDDTTWVRDTYLPGLEKHMNEKLKTP